jgi:voltage-gated potassium channel
MLKYALIGALLVVVTVIIHGVGTLSWAHLIARRYADHGGEVRAGQALPILVGTVLVLLILHALEIVVWAYAYLLFLPSGELGSMEEAVYFSFVTFTTLGYGDITLTQGWRLLSGIEALNGIMLAGWSTAMLFALVQRTWQSIVRRNPRNINPGAAGRQQ